MTYRPHALLRFGGRWFTDEIWSCGLRLITDDSSNTEQMWIDALEPNEPGGVPTFLADAVPMVEAWFERAGSFISDQARLDYVSCNAIGANGLYADGGNPHDYFYDPGTAPVGPSGADTWPQLTTVVSLRTAVTRGLATHGRVYTPTGVVATGSGRIATEQALAMAQSFAQLVEDIATLESIALAGQPRVGVVSDVGTPGPARIVTRCLVGNVLDTQRRRRNALEEIYQAADAVTAP